MGWRDKAKKIGGAVVKSTPVGAAVSGAASGLAGALVDEHGDEIGDLLDKIDRVADAVDGGIVTKAEFRQFREEVNAKLDTLIAMCCKGGDCG